MLLDVEHTAALEAFKARYGRNWKSKLRLAWAAGWDVTEEGGSYLRALRNSPKFNLDAWDREQCEQSE